MSVFRQIGEVSGTRLAREGPDGIVLNTFATDRADADCSYSGGLLRNIVGEASTDTDFDNRRTTGRQTARYAARRCRGSVPGGIAREARGRSAGTHGIIWDDILLIIH